MRTGAIEDIYELTPAQEGMLFHIVRDPGRGLYCEQLSFTLCGEVDIAVFERAWQRMVDRHPVLRTSFHWRDLEKPLQVVHSGAALRCAVYDWRHLPPEEQQRELAAHRAEERRRGFDLASPPLMRLSLVRLAAAEHACTWTFAHIVLDGWSGLEVLREAFVCYGALLRGEDAELPAKRPYRDYVAWLERRGPAGAEEELWRERLRGVSPAWPLGEPAAEPAQSTGDDYAHCDTAIPPALLDVLRSLARRQRLTLNTLVQGAWAVLLGRHLRSRDVVFGITTSGRPSELEGSDSMVGLFVSTLPLRVEIPVAGRLLPWLAALQARQFELRGSEATPLVEIQRWSGLPAGVALFETLLVFENMPVDGSLWRPAEGLEVRDARHLGKTNYPLTLVTVPGSGALSLFYQRHRLHDPSVARMLGHLTTLLAGMARDPDRPLDALPLLSEAEAHMAAVEWNATAACPRDDHRLHELFAAQAGETPDRIAVWCEEEALSYGELRWRARYLAETLRGLGVRAEGRVAVCMEPCLEMVVAVLGVLTAGGAYVPLDPSHPAERRAAILADVEARVVVCREPEPPPVPSVVAVPVLGGAAGGRRLLAGDAGDLAYVLYTSGTTGQPKGVMVEHRSVVHLASALRAALYAHEPAAPLRIGLNGPLTFDTSVKQLVQLLDGHTLDVLPARLRLDPRALLEQTVARRIDVLDCTPSYFRLLTAHGGQTAALPPAMLLGGEAIDGESWRAWSALGTTRVYNLYGPTECTVDASLSPLPGAGHAPTVGRPLEDTRIYLLSEDLRLVPVGAPGELCIGGAGVTRGYHQRPDATAAAFVPDPFSGLPGERLFRTGDLARQRPDGRLEVIGRFDRQVKIRGVRVEPAEVESALVRHPDVLASAVRAHPGADGERLLAAYVVARRERSPIVDGRERYVLPNSLAVVHLNRNETDHLYREVFERQAYTRHGIALEDGACVFDVGANIGLFTLLAHGRARNARIFSFEPNPFVFELLRINASLYAPGARLFDVGLFSAEGEREFTFYPKFSFFSGLYADAAEDKAVVRSFLRAQPGDRGSASLPAADPGIGRALEDLLEDRFERRQLTVRLRTLSDVVEEHGVERIDLLKVNVEKSELEVLAGIRDDDWPKVRQVAMEVHGSRGGVARATELLAARGFEVTAEHDWSLDAGEDIHYVYARRPGAPVHLAAAALAPPPSLLTAGELRQALAEHLPSPLVPSAVIFLEALPLNANAKVDYVALPPPQAAARDPRDRGRATPGSATERILAEIWCEVLRLDRVGVDEPFFDLGGHSLLMVRVLGRLQERLPLPDDLSVLDLFRHPTIRSLAACIDGHGERRAAGVAAQERAERIRRSLLQEAARNERGSRAGGAA